MKTIIAGIFVLFAVSAQAYDLSLDLHVGSKHFNSSQYYNEVNSGYGLTVSEGRKSASIGMYQNSIGRLSTYVIASRDIISRKYFKAAVSFGLVSGYGDRFVPAAFPSIRIGDKYRHNIGFVPKVPGVTPAAIFYGVSVGLN